MAVAIAVNQSNQSVISERSTGVTEQMLADLPVPVQRYMTFTGVVGKPLIETVYLTYSGLFRTGAGKSWMPIRASQFYTTDPPSFLWKAHFKIAGLPLLSGVDIYKNGHSRMLGKLAGLFTVIDGQGEAVDQGTMMRYLQEMTWFPIAYLGSNIAWQAVDDHAADVSLSHQSKTVSGRMYFDDEGRLLMFSAQRYGEFEGRSRLETWTTPTTEYQWIAGLRLPVAGVGVWHLPEGDLPYINIRLDSVDYNCPIESF